MHMSTKLKLTALRRPTSKAARLQPQQSCSNAEGSCGLVCKSPVVERSSWKGQPPQQGCLLNLFCKLKAWQGTKAQHLQHRASCRRVKLLSGAQITCGGAGPREGPATPTRMPPEAILPK